MWKSEVTASALPFLARPLGRNDMPHRHRQLSRRAYESLREQVATAIALCSDEQVLDLADALHDTLRRRRSAEGRTFAPGGSADPGDDFRLVS